MKICLNGIDYNVDDPIVKDLKKKIYQDIDQPTYLWCCVFNLKTSEITIGTIRGHIFIVNSNNQVIRIIVTNNENMRINSIEIDSLGRIWYISRYGKGYGVISKDKDIFIPGRISAIYTDRNGGAYVAEKYNNIVKIKHIYEDCEKYEAIAEFADIDVLVIFRNDNELWLGTSLGLYLIIEGKIIRYTKKDGLSCNIITALLKGKDGILWIGTEGGGVCCFDGNVFQSIQIPEEFGYNIVNDIVEDSRNRLWVSTEAGLVQYQRGKNRPSVRIVEIVGDRSSLGENISQFPCTITSLSFHFKGSSSGENPQYLVYKYRLIGHTKKWQQTNDEKIEYRALSPGHYIFEVQSINRDLNYSRIEKCRIMITADPWVSALALDSSDKFYKTDAKLNNGEVLLLDQDQIFLDYCARFLRGRGYTVTIGSEYEDIEENLSRYDVIIINSDSFIEIGSKNKRVINRLSIKSIVTTDINDLKAVDNVIRFGAFTYITKPFESNQLIDKIQKVIYSQKDDLLLYIRNHLQSIITREDIANVLGVSPNTISNRVRKSCSMGFSDFLQLCRVQEAQKLLVQTNLQIHQIANSAGFQSHEGLTRVFKKHTGYTPREYRTKIRSIQL